MKSSEQIKRICLEGTPEERRKLFAFNDTMSVEKVAYKFQLFTRTFFHRYYQQKSAPFHNVMVINYLTSYLLGQNKMELAFRGAAKTSLLELVVVFVLLNDESSKRKYAKILSRDLKNSKKMVTDIYNKLVELEHVYGDVFEQEGKKKREETMSSFIMKKGVQVSAGTVGQAQRGHKQDAYRPDWILFEDIEDRETISSAVITAGIIGKCDEAVTGMSQNGCYVVNGNYISEDGTIEWFKRKPSVQTNITPLEIGGIPTWDVFTPEKIQQLKEESLDYAGEYLCDPARSGSKYFDIDRVTNDMLNVKPPIKVVGGVKYYATYKSDHKYGSGADTAEGKGQDSCALSLFDFTTNELVATYASNTIFPDLFGFELIRVGREFGQCIIAPEINNTSGGTVIQVLKQEEYPEIYRKEIKDKLNNVLTKQLGWHTNTSTKSSAFAEFRRDYNAGKIKIYDEDLLKEMRAYNVNDISEEKGLLTRHFDLLMSAVIAWQMRDHAQVMAADDDDVWGEYNVKDI